jgi:hypothetical protein
MFWSELPQAFHSNRIENSGVAQIVEAMPKNNASLPDLNLKSINIQGHHGGQGLARLLRRCKQMKRIIIGSNRLGVGGARALAPAISNHDCLKEVWMRGCIIGSNRLGVGGARALAPAIPNHDCLKEVWMRGCRLVADGAIAILTSPAACPRIQSLGLDDNELPTSTLAPMTEFLNTSGKRLEMILLYDNDRLLETAKPHQSSSTVLRSYRKSQAHLALANSDVFCSNRRCCSSSSCKLTAVTIRTKQNRQPRARLALQKE